MAPQWKRFSTSLKVREVQQLVPSITRTQQPCVRDSVPQMGQVVFASPQATETSRQPAQQAVVRPHHGTLNSYNK